jgi:hypothetical protein
MQHANHHARRMSVQSSVESTVLSAAARLVTVVGSPRVRHQPRRPSPPRATNRPHAPRSRMRVAVIAPDVSSLLLFRLHPRHR